MCGTGAYTWSKGEKPSKWRHDAWFHNRQDAHLRKHSTEVSQYTRTEPLHKPSLQFYLSRVFFPPLSFSFLMGISLNLFWESSFGELQLRRKILKFSFGPQSILGAFSWGTGNYSFIFHYWCQEQEDAKSHACHMRVLKSLGTICPAEKNICEEI